MSYIKEQQIQLQDEDSTHGSSDSEKRPKSMILNWTWVPKITQLSEGVNVLLDV